ncbi:MAG: tRNA (adenosine(37)-N6)-dimethylallyltransferase MiaA [Gemmatimonadaceae bacterium]
MTFTVVTRLSGCHGTSWSDGLDVVRLPIICGPTAVGKSSLALELAESVGASIVSADSRQVYRGFNIGTAKPSTVERARVPHYGIDVVDPTTRYSAAKWVEGVSQWFSETELGGRSPLIVGGTGFYLKALTTPLFEEPELDPRARADLTNFLDALETSELRRWVLAIDPPRAALGRTQLLRAIEVAVLSGERISDLHASSLADSPWAPSYLVVDPGKVLAERIERRVDEMLRSGWVDEVRRLVHLIPSDAPAWNASGYQAIRGVVEGSQSLGTARERVIIETRQYAKRQRTWFRHQLGAAVVQLLDPAAPDAFEQALAWWRSVHRSENAT